MKEKTLEEVLYELVQDLYDAEKQIVRALPKMAKAAASEQLREAFQEHLEETKEQVNRIEQVFEALGQKAKSKKCEGMRGLLEEGQEVMSSFPESAARDAALIAAAQKVEHYEMAGYGSARTFAKLLDRNEAADLLEETLNEEKAADEKLTGVAESTVNEHGGEEEAEEGDEEQSSSRSRTGARRRAAG